MTAAAPSFHVIVASPTADLLRAVSARIRSGLPETTVTDIDMSKRGNGAACLSPAPSEERTDLVVLVLPTSFRPGDHGGDALSELLEQFQACGPVLALLENADVGLGLALLRAGAEDWAPLAAFDPRSLIHRVVSRYRAHQDTWESAVEANLAGEASRIGEIMASGSTPITARTFSQSSVRAALPDLFEDLLQGLRTLIDQAVDDRIYGRGHSRESDLVTLAERLGFVRAGPRDVIDLYVTLLRAPGDTVPARRRAVANEEMRLLVLQLMGHLANYYRLRVVGAPLKKADRGYQG